MNAKTLLSLGVILLGGAVYALHTDKMVVNTVCRDTRLYMDGGSDAEIFAGGLNYHHSIKVFRRENNKDVFVQDYVVDSETQSSQAPVQTFVSNQGLKLSIFKNQKLGKFGYPSHIEYSFNGEKNSVDLNCSPKKLF
jgi:hypothetical protein